MQCPRVIDLSAQLKIDKEFVRIIYNSAQIFSKLPIFIGKKMFLRKNVYEDVDLLAIFV